MAETTIAQPAEAIRERTLRGLQLYREQRERIYRIEGDVWTVPASNGGCWWVDLKNELCPCPDFEHYGSKHDVCCKHLIAAAIARAKRPPQAHRPQDHPHACLDGYIYLGQMVESAHDLAGEVEVYERLPCRRCAEQAAR
jgi:SWIM zinc finger